MPWSARKLLFFKGFIWYSKSTFVTLLSLVDNPALQLYDEHLMKAVGGVTDVQWSISRAVCE